MSSLFWIDLLYNLTLGGVVAALLLGVCRRPAFRSVPAASLALALAGCLAAAGVGGSPAGIVRMLAYGIFMHGTILLAGSAALLWRGARKTSAACAIASMALAAVAVDAFWIEPQQLQVTHLRFETPAVSEPVRIVVLADFQTDTFGDYERSVLQRVVAQQPDLILAAGDYVQADPVQTDIVRNAAAQYMRQIGVAGRRGVFAVRGNIDDPDWATFFDGVPVVAVQRTQSFDLGGGIALTCLGLNDSFDARLRLGRPNAGAYHVVVGHCPNYALGAIDADLLLAGHTHGGQVQLPWIGPLVTASQVSRAMASGVSALPGGGTLVVSRGTGMERGYAPRMRFLCRPELVVIELVPQP